MRKAHPDYKKLLIKLGQEAPSQFFILFSPNGTPELMDDVGRIRSTDPGAILQLIFDNLPLDGKTISIVAALKDDELPGRTGPEEIEEEEIDIRKFNYFK